MTTTVLARIILALFLLAGNAGASVLTKRIQFENPTVTSTSGGVIIAIEGCRSIGNPGAPILPMYPACFIIPPGEVVSRVTIEAQRTIALEGSFDVAPMQPQAPIGSLPTNSPQSTLSPARNPAIYQSSQPFPAEKGELATEQIASGVRLAFVTLNPCSYIPSSGTVLFSPSLLVTIETERSAPVAGRTSAERFRSVMRALEKNVQNPELASAYTASVASLADTVSAGELAHYVIITSSAFVSSFQLLADIKTQCGMRSRIVDTEWIAANFGGLDLQERIRNFIAYAYANWNTQYVVLGGDDEIIPHRGLYVKVGTEIDADIPSDLYYSCLDGNWNSDGDAYFGEPGEEDLLPEVVVGRLPVDSAEEIANVIQKITSYTLTPVVSQNRSALLLGELLWSIAGVNTWGGDYKDEIRYGSSNWGFTTAGVPSEFATSTLYDRDMGSWNKNHLVPLLNSGVHFVNHLGHSNLFMVMRLAVSDIPALTNDGVASSFFICYSQGCYAASFDNRDDAGTVYAADCIGEELVTGPHGAVAFIGNTRFGWNAPGSTCGVSQFFDRRFFDAIFGEGIVQLGPALDDSRFDTVAYIAFDAVRWVYYGMCLLGDPALSVWTDAPRTLNAEHDSILFARQNGFEVRVSDERGPVAGALVCLNSATPGVFCTAISDETGSALLQPCGVTESSVLLTIASRDHYPYNEILPIESAAPFLPSLALVAVNDGLSATGVGDGDGIAEPGETVEPAILVQNIGLGALTNVALSLSSSDTLLIVGDGQCSVGEIPAGGSVFIDTAFSVEIRTCAENVHAAVLEFTVTSNEGIWRIPQVLIVNAPKAALESWAMSETGSGNGNGCLEAWEFQSLLCTYRNSGAADVIAPVLTLSFPENSWGKTIKGTVETATIPAGASITFPGELLWFVNELTPPFSDISLILTLEGDNIAPHAETLRVQTCGNVLNHAADSEAPFHHTAIIGVDQWHVSSEAYHSAPASLKCGSPSGGAYANITETVLTLPPLCLYSNSTLTFWHRMSAEAGTTYPYWALDAGVLELSQDNGRSWRILTPSALYPSRASPYNTIFLAAYQRCWSGIFDWRKETFDLSSYQGSILIRFHFASNEQYGFEGWYIDDICVSTDVPTDAGGIDAPAIPFTTRMEPSYPNPFNPRTIIPYELAETGVVQMKIFDVAGRLVRTLLEGSRERGRHSASWDGRDDGGRMVASGIYFCRFKALAYAATTRLVVIR